MAATREFTFSSEVPVHYGQHSTENMARFVERVGCERPLIVTDPNLAESGILDAVTAPLDEKGVPYEFFTGVEPNPKKETIRRGVETARETQVDGTIAVGGGSSIDTGKGIALLHSNGGTVDDYRRTQDGSYVELETEPTPLIAVPTTVGTGSEVTGGLVVTDSETKEKVLVGGESFYPSQAVLDPKLLETLPPDITAATGMDSFTQAVESYISLGATPLTEALALRAIGILARNIRPAVTRGDVEALGQMQIATTMGGIALTNSGLGLVHSISHVVSAHYDTAHGVTNAVLLPHVLEYNLVSQVEKFSDMAQVMGRHTRDVPHREAAERFLDEIRVLNDDLGMPAGLSELGIDRDDIPTLAADTVAQTDPNPRQYTKADVVSILENAY